MESGTPISIWWQLFLSHAVIMVMTTPCSTENDDELVRKRQDRVFQRRRWFFPLSGSRCFASSGERRSARSVASIRQRSAPCKADLHSSGVVNARCGILAKCPSVWCKTGDHVWRFAFALDRTRANWGPRPAQVGDVL